MLHLITLGENDVNVLGQNTTRHNPMSSYCFLDNWTECDHPLEWVKTAFVHVADFVGMAKIKPTSA